MCYSAYVESPKRICRNVGQNLLPENLGYSIDPEDALTAIRSKGLYYKFHRDEVKSLIRVWSDPSVQLDEPSSEEEVELKKLYRQWDF